MLEFLLKFLLHMLHAVFHVQDGFDAGEVDAEVAHEPTDMGDALDVTVGKYSQVNGPGFATVEIFRFPDFVKAFGAYSMRKQGTFHIIKLQNESFQNAHSIQIGRGAFYVRVVGQPADQLVKLAGSVADKMPAAPGKPAVFNFLPDQFRVPNSERYSAESGLGQPYLANSFQTSFDVRGDAIDGLVIPAANKNAAAAILNAYRTLFVQNGKLLDPIPNMGEDNFTAEDKFLGRAVAFRIDRFVVVFNGFQASTSQGLLTLLLAVVGYFLWILYVRVALEFLVAMFRTAENIARASGRDS